MCYLMVRARNSWTNWVTGVTTPATADYRLGRDYLADATLPSEPLIFSFWLVPSVFTTSISYFS